LLDCKEEFIQNLHIVKSFFYFFYKTPTFSLEKGKALINRA